MRPVLQPAARQSPADCRARPIRSPRDSISCRRPAPRRFRHGFKNLAVAGAAAEISGEPFANLIHRGIGLSVQQVHRCENHPRRADAALRSAALQKSLLQRVQLFALRQSFNRDDARACRPEERAPDSCLRARHPSTPSTNRTRLLRSLLSRRSIQVPIAARRAGAPSDTRVLSSTHR